MTHTFETIGHIRSPYTDKFGIPRQSGLVPAARIRIELLPHFSPDCVRGLEQFGLIWVQFVFHATQDEGWAPLVRPPRLGGKAKKGVFATRSPHRPNPLGLSLLQLDAIEHTPHTILHCSGADLLDGTPVLDIKPYIPFVEAHPHAAAGFASAPPPQLTVHWADHLTQPAPELTQLIEQSLAQDPRPAYHDLPDRIYFMEIQGHTIQFRIQDQHVHIINIDTISNNKP